MVNLSKTLRNMAIMLAASAWMGGAASAQDTMLTLTNSITEAEILLTEDGIMALDQVVMNTTNEFVDEMTAFGGPLARDVVALLGGGAGDTVVLTAVNDYSIEVPVQDFIDYDVVFAHSTNGDRLSTRDKGPIWVVYPMSDNPELRDPTYNARMIWQLVSVEIK
ncbi:MAG: hypothetical protein L3J33_00195 [Rhodobacteraceae bacterium]|nr:hypothetical protein [Paracoccaceae bacterium]